MKVTLEGIGKRFNNREWVMRGLNHTFEKNQSYAIVGSNGSGKTTLTRIISGISPPSAGAIKYEFDGNLIDPDSFFKHLTYAAPYLELIEEYTLLELLHFHFQFKKIRKGMTINDLIDIMYLAKNENKQISNFSSGMKQRLQLGLAFFSEASITILDEPTSNMDEKGISWYLEQIKTILGDRIVIIASNQNHEYNFIEQSINMNEANKGT